MSNRKIRVLSLLAVPAIAIALVAFLSWGLANGSSTPKVAADAPHAGVDFHIQIDAGGSVNTGCSTASGPGNATPAAIPASCNIDASGVFTVRYFLDDNDAVSYSGYDTKTDYTGGVGNLVRKADAVMQPPLWPECDIPATFAPNTSSYLFGCAEGLPHPIPSIYEGEIARLDFTCSATTAVHTISLKNGVIDTSITDATGPHATDELSETLTISCKVPPPTSTSTNTFTPTNTPTNTPTATPPPVPRWMKQQRYPYTNAPSQCESTNPDVPPGCSSPQDPPKDDLGNLWLTRQGAKIPPLNCQQSSDNAVFSEVLQFTPHVPDPKGVHTFAFIGGFEFEVHFNAKLVCVNLVPGSAATDLGLICFIDDKANGQPLEGMARMGCVTKGKNKRFPAEFKTKGPELAQVWVKPQPELYSQIRANQDNGVVAQLLDSNCELSDEQGHPIPIFSCEDAEVTIRFLEGDVEPNCRVDAADQQNVAFRWGAALGSLLFNSRFDLEPSGTVKGDGDIDIKDLQFVFGRFNSSCGRQVDDNQVGGGNGTLGPGDLKLLPEDSIGSPHPRQGPRNSKS